MTERTARDIEAEWWERWWAADYSWNAFPARTILHIQINHPEQSLQRYWRIDPDTGVERTDEDLLAVGELVDIAMPPQGTVRRWHVAHIPLRWRDGSPAKEAWDETQVTAFDALIASRLAAARPDVVADDMNILRDDRARFAGVVLLKPLVHPSGTDVPIHVDADRCYLPGWDAGQQSLGPSTDFREALFAGACAFRVKTFVGNHFQGCIFLQPVVFEDVSFAENAGFAGTQFAGEVRFCRVTFERQVSFYGTFFGHGIDLTNCTAEGINFGKADFRGNLYISVVTATDYMNFSEAVFNGSFGSLNSLYTKRLDFRQTVFRKSAHFREAEHAQSVTFEKATFEGPAVFHRTRFEKPVNFDNASFLASTDFSGLVAADVATFNGATFAGPVAFSGAAFNGPVQFERSRFLHTAAFDGVIFKQHSNATDPPQLFVTFNAATFAMSVDFRGSTFPPAPAHHSAAFAGARFGGIADFRDTGMAWIAALDDATFGDNLLLDDLDEREALRRFDREMLRAIRRPDSQEQLRPELAAVLLKQLEGGCRVVKLAMNKAHDEVLEQRYYRFQLRARRLQRSTPGVERAVGWLYQVSSDFGLSAARPLVGILLLFLLFAAAYAGIARAAGMPAGVFDVLPVSASRTFPFGAFEDVSKDWIARVSTNGGVHWQFLARVVASAQSLCSAILAFLFSLALRRRFQLA